MLAARKGSSLKYSKLRPVSGDRAMLTPGPSRKWTPRAGIAAQALADPARQSRVPTGCQRGSASIGSGRSPGAHTLRTVGHLKTWQTDGRSGLREHVIDAAQKLDLLVQRKPGHQSMSLGLNLWRVRSGSLCKGGQCATLEQSEQECDAQRQKRLSREVL